MVIDAQIQISLLLYFWLDKYFYILVITIASVFN